MRKLLFMLLMVPALIIGQHTVEISTIINPVKGSEWFLADQLDIRDQDYDFIGLSAYVSDPNFEGQLFYQFETTEGFSKWDELHRNTHGETPGRVAFEADPILHTFQSIRFKSDVEEPVQVTFRLFLPLEGKNTPYEITEGSSSCSCIQPSYCDRWCWCPDSSCTTNYTPTPTQPTHIIVHHSAGFNTSTDYKMVVAYYWDLHVNTNGWDDLGYNWLIDPNGVVYEGRGSGVAGAHFSCMNSGTTGICLIGNYQGTPPPAPAVLSLEELAAWESCDKNIVIDGTSLHTSSQLVLPHLSGHRDGNSSTVGCPSGTVCPGTDLYQQLPGIATQIAANPCLTGVGNQELNLSNLQVYPNPAGNHVTITGAQKIESVSLYDLNGQTLLSEIGHPEIISLENLSEGIYLLRVETDEGYQTHRIIKL